MMNIGDRVKITNVTRTRTIFQNSEVTPGSTKTYNLNATGVITQVYDNQPGTSYEVKIDGRPEGQDHIEVHDGELEKI